MAKKKKVLFVATVDSHILAFHLPYLELFKQKGWETHVATNGKEKIPFCDHKHTICMERSPFRLNNLKAIKQMKKLLEKEHFDIIHCHTPMGSVVTRLAAKKARKNGTRVIYTAHGFHFYTGAPLINWLLFYPVEWYLAKYTDTLITINHEDYNRAKKKFSKRCHDIQYVPGVGIDPKKFDFKMTQKEKHELRASLGLKDDDFVMIFPARLDKNKNQGFLIKCMPKLIKENPKIYLLLPGQDELNGKYQNLAKKLGVENNVHFLGKRDDVPRLLKISNIVVSSSKREGLPCFILESILTHRAIVGLKCRGISDIIDDQTNCFLVEKKDFNSTILKLQNNMHTRTNINTTQYMTKTIILTMEAIYDKKNTIIHLLQSNKLSGAENVAISMINHLKDMYDCYYCSPVGPICKTLKERGIKYIPLVNNNIKEYSEIIKKYKPVIIHAHDVKASLIASTQKTRNIFHVHFDFKKLTIKSIVFLIATINCKKIIWVSNKSLHNYPFYKIIKMKSTVLENRIDAKYIHDKIRQDENKYPEYDMIYLGRLEDIKNPIRAIEIVNRIIKIYPDVKLAIVGDGNLEEEMKDKIRSYNLQGNISLYGRLENPYKILNQSKILLVTSVAEGLPLSVLEALSLNKYVVSTKVGDLPRLSKKEGSIFIYNTDEEASRLIASILSKNNKNKAKIKPYNEYIRAIKKIYREIT